LVLRYIGEMNLKKTYLVAAGACIFALMSGGVCKSQAAAPQLVPAKQLRKGIDAMPKLAVPTTPAMKKINATMQRRDQDSLAMLKDCKSYQRVAKPTMLGPGYFSVWTNESWDCGAYPTTNTVVVLFDLATGDAVDWTKIVSGATQYSDTGADGKNGSPQAVVLPALTAMYLKDPDNAGDCQNAYQDSQSFLVWPEAKTGTLKVEAFDLPHVTGACANDMVLTLDQAKTLGFSVDFLSAVAAAHKLPGAATLAAPAN
jgi:hypothetical protein